jgi:hypothetical protein
MKNSKYVPIPNASYLFDVRTYHAMNNRALAIMHKARIGVKYKDIRATAPHVISDTQIAKA